MIMLAGDIAKKIRKDLKEVLGYNRNHVSVTKHEENAVLVKVKDKEINKEEIKEFAKHYESVHQDEVTGEILSGGNTFVFVQ
ncbi:hypothetical protein [Staphylococcus delphini]|uniref:hypothetical protein n=1 Tax=Staphylococcus delphini TaxID=53344 RepID=UPI000BBBB941|nr:hypothetical protein [Staphylococcus delphini]PCF79311.1 hypothetical protein B4W69_13100 [Staphylococcus delphini]